MDIKDKALARTVAPIEKVHPNPFRNFEINSIRDDHVNKLLTSIEDIGMWSGLAARKIPDTIPAEYEIACGHHRLEAIKRAGLSNVAVDIRPYTDEQMIRIMVEENMTQRGNENAGTVLDSVAAVIIQIVKDCFAEGDKCNLPEVKGNILAGKGVGHKTINQKQPTISLRNALDAIHILKASGGYADLFERGGAPKEIVKLYQADEVEALPKALKAVTLFEKVSHGKVFINTVRSNQNTCDRLEDEYCDCAKSILEDTLSVTSERVERAVLDYFEVEEQPATPEVTTECDQDNKKSTVPADKPTLPQEARNSDTTPEPSGKEQEESIDTIPDPPAAVESISSCQEVFQQLELAINNYMKDGWKAVTKTSTLSSLKKLTIKVCEDQSAIGDIPPAERLGDTIIDLIESIDHHKGRSRDKTLRNIQKVCDERLKGTAQLQEPIMEEAA